MLQTPARRAATIVVLAVVLAGLVVGFGAWKAPVQQSFDDRIASPADGDDAGGAGTGPGGDGSGFDGSDDTDFDDTGQQGSDGTGQQGSDGTDQQSSDGAGRQHSDGADDASGGDDGVVQSLGALAERYWQGLYVYAVSLLAVLWILARLRTQWRLDRDAPGLVPVGGAARLGEEPSVATAEDATGLDERAPAATEDTDDA